MKALLAVFLASAFLAGCDQIADVIYPKNEPATKDNLENMRLLLNDFYQRNNSKAALSIGEAVTHIPAAETGRHPRRDTVVNACSDGKDKGQLQDTGGWAYCGQPKNESWGRLTVDCTHKDSTGKPWYSY